MTIFIASLVGYSNIIFPYRDIFIKIYYKLNLILFSEKLWKYIDRLNYMSIFLSDLKILMCCNEIIWIIF